MATIAKELAVRYPKQLSEVVRHFPNLNDPKEYLTSPPIASYNCIAWAVDIDNIHWWPTPRPVTGCYWPPEVPPIAHIIFFYMAYSTLGFVQIEESDIYKYKKIIALMGRPDGTVTHAMKLLSNGKWSSKLGKNFDISHDLHSLDSDVYGTVIGFMGKDHKG